MEIRLFSWTLLNKTTKYELPMFFVTVKTNVGYTLITDFVVQSETGIQIELLRLYM